MAVHQLAAPRVARNPRFRRDRPPGTPDPRKRAVLHKNRLGPSRRADRDSRQQGGCRHPKGAVRAGGGLHTARP